MDKPLVSVIIPTHNSSSTLETCLVSVALQSYPNIEVIVVDNYSVDDTLNTAKKYGSRILRVKALRSVARNYGAKDAKGDFLLFVDSDMELTNDVVEECVRKSIDSGVDALMIPEVRVGEGFWAKCRALERITYIGDPLIESIRFVRKDVFASVDGYDGQLEAGEDWDLHARVEDSGCKIMSINAAIKHHEGRLTARKIIMKRYYYGKTLMKYVKKHAKKSGVQFIPIRLNYIRKWRILVNHPLQTCGMLLMKMLEYITTTVAILSTLLNNTK